RARRPATPPARARRRRRGSRRRAGDTAAPSAGSRPAAANCGRNSSPRQDHAHLRANDDHRHHFRSLERRFLHVDSERPIEQSAVRDGLSLDFKIGVVLMMVVLAVAVVVLALTGSTRETKVEPTVVTKTVADAP